MTINKGHKEKKIIDTTNAQSDDLSHKKQN